MDRDIARIVDLCRFQDDPNWNLMSRLFVGVTLESYQKILKNKDTLVAGLIQDSDAEKVGNHIPVRTLDRIIEPLDAATVRVKQPVVVDHGLDLHQYGLRIGQEPVYLGEGVILQQAMILDKAYISAGAKVQNSNIFPGNGYSFIGENTKIVNVPEFKGCFVSGGPLRETGRRQMHFHGDKVFNMVVGAYSAPTVGFSVYNHPYAGERSVIVYPDEVGEMRRHVFPDLKENRKLPVLVGVGATLGAGQMIHSGSIIAADAVASHEIAHVEGLIYNVNGLTCYAKARRERDLFVHIACDKVSCNKEHTCES